MLTIFALVCKFMEDDKLVCYHSCERERKAVTPWVRIVSLRSLILVYVYSTTVGGVTELRNINEELNIPWWAYNVPFP